MDSGILGHRAQLLSLQNDLERGNVAHAYLFSGPRHVGKFTIAKGFALALLSDGLDDAARERAADEIEKLLHPDLLVLDQLWIEDVQEDFDVIAKSSNVLQVHRQKAKAKTDTISIDDIRSLQDRLHEVGRGKYRCCLIRSVERMQDEAVNALLKILEEPPQGVVFLLTTQSFASLLPTLISRTRVTHFTRLTDGEMSPLFEKTSEEERAFLLRVAQGSPGVVRRLRDDPDLLRVERQVHNSALAFWHSRSPLERLQLLKPLKERGEEADQFLLHLALGLREELDTLPPASAEQLFSFQRKLETNVNRELLSQQFVLGLETVK
jgi:DNA polymerase-3 subunit delta'